MEKNEFELIKNIDKLIKKSLPQTNGIGIGDDCALLSDLSPDYDVLITKDLLVEDIHFKTSTYSFSDIGYKSAIVNISDLISKGATPTNAFIGLSIPKNINYNDIINWYKGFIKACKKYNIAISGGDTTSSRKHFFISVTLLGKAQKNKMILRSGAEVNDYVYVLGNLGESSLGLEMLTNKNITNNIHHATRIHLRPIIFYEKWFEIINNKKINASIDISDGLMQDASHIAKKSNVKIIINKDSNWKYVNSEYKKAENKWAMLKHILSGGEDYAILFTTKEKIEEEKNLIKIGYVEEYTKKQSVILRDTNGVNIAYTTKGFNHF